MKACSDCNTSRRGSSVHWLSAEDAAVAAADDAVDDDDDAAGWQPQL